MSTELSTAPADPVARRERLAVLCALDRATLRLALCPPKPPAGSNPVSSGTNGLRTVLAVTQFFPGAIGRWSRRLALGGGLLRRVLS